MLTDLKWSQVFRSITAFQGNCAVKLVRGIYKIRVRFADVYLSLGSSVADLHTLKPFHSKDVILVTRMWLPLQKVGTSSATASTVIGNRLQAAYGPNWLMAGPYVLKQLVYSIIEARL